jgi:hypothetical protein
MAMSIGTNTAYGDSDSVGSEAHHELEMTNVIVEDGSLTCFYPLSFCFLAQLLITTALVAGDQLLVEGDFQ